MNEDGSEQGAWMQPSCPWGVRDSVRRGSKNQFATGN